MRIIEPSQFRKPLRKKRHTGWLLLFTALILMFGYTAAAVVKPLPSVKGIGASLSVAPLDPPVLTWPDSGQAALGAVGYGVLAKSGAQTTAPIASVAKLMTALAVLRQKPLKSGQTGPMITINTADVNSYYDYVARGGSVVPVNLGEQLSQYQALQALLLPSANNMADTLIRWAFGSEQAYVAFAKRLAVSLGLNQTHIADASGFSAQTTSTPENLVLLGLAALQEPVLAEIVKQPTANLPVAGEIRNTNGLLGQNGIDGLKTGHTEEAGGCFLFSSTQSYPNGQKVTLVGAVMGAADLTRALRSSATLLRSAIPGFRVITLVRQEQVVGSYQTPWGVTAKAVASQEASLLVWSSQLPHLKLNLDEVDGPIAAGATVGHIAIESNQQTKDVPVILQTTISPPTLQWRLSHFVNFKT